MDDGAQIKIHGDIISEVPDDDDKDGHGLETTGVESMPLSE
jgi:hypothetical protein